MNIKQRVVEALQTSPDPVRALVSEWLPTPRAYGKPEKEIAELNAHLHYCLWEIGQKTNTDVLEVRRSLIQTNDPDEWIRVFKRDVVPFLERILV